MQDGGRARPPSRPSPIPELAEPRAAESAGSTQAAGYGGHLPTGPSAVAGSGWLPASHVDAPPSPAPTPLARPRRLTPVRAPAAPTHWAGPRSPGPFKPGPYHRAGRGRPGRAGPPGARTEAAPATGPRGAQRAARDPRSRLGSRPASGPPSHNGRVRGTRLSPSYPPAASGNPGTRARPRHTPSGPALSCAGAHRPRPARAPRSAS